VPSEDAVFRSINDDLMSLRHLMNIKYTLKQSQIESLTFAFGTGDLSPPYLTYNAEPSHEIAVPMNLRQIDFGLFTDK